jgi:hypothetical protein
MGHDRRSTSATLLYRQLMPCAVYVLIAVRRRVVPLAANRIPNHGIACFPIILLMHSEPSRITQTLDRGLLEPSYAREWDAYRALLRQPRGAPRSTESENHKRLCAQHTS